MDKKTLLSVGFATALIALGLHWGLSDHDGVSVREIPVELGPIHAIVAVTGRVVSERETLLTASVPGRVTVIHVTEGEPVRKGQVLALLDDREALTQVARAQARLRQAQAETEQAARSNERAQRLFQLGGISRQSLEEADTQLQSAKAREAVAVQEVAAARLGMEHLRIRAPYDGVVTARSVKLGQWVVPDAPLFVLADTGQQEIEAKVDVTDSGTLAVGQLVLLSSEALSGRTWEGRVTRLAPIAVKEEGANVVKVRIALGPDAPTLRMGQQVDAKIRTASANQALKLPIGALIEDGGRKWVAVVRNSRIQRVPIATGIEDLTHVQVLHGLSAGHLVLLPEGQTLREGERVSVQSAASAAGP